MNINGKDVERSSIKMAGVDTGDYPDFCDAYIKEACFDDGTPLTDDELELLNEDGSLVHEMAHAEFQ